MSALVKTIRLFHSVHGTSMAIRNGEKPVEEAIRKVAFHPQNFPAFLTLTCLVSGVAGFELMESIRRQVPAVNDALNGSA